MNNNFKIAKIPRINIPVMSDDEWNRLAHRNFIERKYYMNEVFSK